MRRIAAFAVVPFLWVASSALLALDAAAASQEAKIVLTKDEQILFDLLNQERKAKELKPLATNDVLIRLARAHSANMAKHDKMDHVLDEKGPVDRADAIGYPYMRIGENIAYSDKGFEPDAVHKSWMNSKVHRDNILGPDFAEAGVGVFVDAKGKKWYTQVFGTQLK